MKTYLRMLAKSFALVVATIAIFTLSQGVARADEVTISGNTSGIVTGVPQLTFVGNALFSGTTALGIGSLSGLNSLGTFHLSPDVTQLLNGNFNLTLIFTSPTGINGGPGTTYTATVQGSVSPNLDQGGVNINFPSPTQTFTFSNGTNTGSFSLTVPNLFVQTGRSADLTAG